MSKREKTMNKTDWKIPHLEIKKGEWYVCTNDWSDDGWCKFRKGDVVQAVDDYTFLDCYEIPKTFKTDGICYFRPADKDEIPEYARLKDIELTEFEQALSDYDIVDEYFINTHDGIEIKHETRRIAGELLPLARKILEHDIRREILRDMPHWQRSGGAMGGCDRAIYLVRSSKGHYIPSSSVGPNDVYLTLKDLEKLPGVPREKG